MQATLAIMPWMRMTAETLMSDKSAK
jgi:hypothetical protein